MFRLSVPIHGGCAFLWRFGTCSCSWRVCLFIEGWAVWLSVCRCHRWHSDHLATDPGLAHSYFSRLDCSAPGNIRAPTDAGCGGWQLPEDGIARTFFPLLDALHGVCSAATPAPLCSSCAQMHGFVGVVALASLWFINSPLTIGYFAYDTSEVGAAQTACISYLTRACMHIYTLNT